MSADAAVDPARTAETFFQATAAGDWAAALAVTSPEMIVWQSGDRERLFHESVPFLRRLRERTGHWEYLNIRRIVSDKAFCEQHVVRFHAPEGPTSDYEVCAVGRLDCGGRLIRLDEYVTRPPNDETTSNESKSGDSRGEQR